MKHNQLSKNLEHIGHTHQQVSYGVQPINNVECDFFYQGDKRMSKGTRVCDVIKEKISNGMLPYKRYTPYNQLTMGFIATMFIRMNMK